MVEAICSNFKAQGVGPGSDVEGAPVPIIKPVVDATPDEGGKILILTPNFQLFQRSSIFLPDKSIKTALAGSDIAAK